jgi:hypothetical protein
LSFFYHDFFSIDYYREQAKRRAKQKRGMRFVEGPIDPVIRDEPEHNSPSTPSELSARLLDE